VNSTYGEKFEVWRGRGKERTVKKCAASNGSAEKIPPRRRDGGRSTRQKAQNSRQGEDDWGEVQNWGKKGVVWGGRLQQLTGPGPTH